MSRAPTREAIRRIMEGAEAFTRWHHDTGLRCLVYHGGDDESKGEACIHCSCGAYVRPHNWEDHVAQEERSGDDRRVGSSDQRGTRGAHGGVRRDPAEA